MSCPQDNSLVPSLQDSLCDSATRGFGFRDEQPVDLPAHPEQSPEEVEAEYAWFMAREAERDARRAAACVDAFAPLAEAAERVKRQLAEQRPVGYCECVCDGCGCVLLVREGERLPVYCSTCSRAAVAV